MIDAKKYIEEIDKKQDKLTSLSDEIWDYAETAFTEFQSVEALQKFFESEGFLVTPHAYGVETAFRAEYGSSHRRSKRSWLWSQSVGCRFRSGSAGHQEISGRWSCGNGGLLWLSW